MRVILHEEGVRSFWKGISPTLLGLLATWGFYFPCYEEMKRILGKRDGYSSDVVSVNMCSAVVAGAGSAMITAPIWLVRTRLQIQGDASGQLTKPYKGVLDAFVRIPREEGLRHLWNGLGPSLIGLVHVGVQLPLYEKLKQLFTEHQSGKKEASVMELMAASSLSKIVASCVAYPHEGDS